MISQMVSEHNLKQKITEKSQGPVLHCCVITDAYVIYYWFAPVFLHSFCTGANDLQNL